MDSRPRPGSGSWSQSWSIPASWLAGIRHLSLFWLYVVFAGVLSAASLELAFNLCLSIVPLSLPSVNRCDSPLSVCPWPVACCWVLLVLRVPPSMGMHEVNRMPWLLKAKSFTLQLIMITRVCAHSFYGWPLPLPPIANTLVQIHLLYGIVLEGYSNVGSCKLVFFPPFLLRRFNRRRFLRSLIHLAALPFYPFLLTLSASAL